MWLCSLELGNEKPVSAMQELAHSALSWETKAAHALKLGDSCANVDELLRWVLGCRRVGGVAILCCPVSGSRVGVLVGGGLRLLWDAWAGLGWARYWRIEESRCAGVWK